MLANWFLKVHRVNVFIASIEFQYWVNAYIFSLTNKDFNRICVRDYRTPWRPLTSELKLDEFDDDRVKRQPTDLRQSDA